MARKTHCLGALRIGTAFAALTATAPLVAQVADEPPIEVAEISDVDEGNAIVVTARSRAETHLNRPITVPAFHREHLEVQGGMHNTAIREKTHHTAHDGNDEV